LNQLRSFGLFLHGNDFYKEAEQIHLQALEGSEEVLGSDNTLTLNTVNSLGNLYKDQGKLAEAEKMYERALEGYEKALGASTR
jgi:tetratricopeptide (TPR) repeat protein